MSGDKPSLPAHLTRGRGRGIFFNTGLLASPTPSVASVSTSSRGGSTASQQITTALGAKRGTTRDETRVVYSTKPSGVVNKQGNAGKAIQLFANYFRLLKKPEFEFNVYRLDFDPLVDEEAMRKSFLRQHKDKLGGYLYDGAQLLYLTHRLSRDTLNLSCESREGVKYQVTVRHTDRVIGDTDLQCMQILNLILRQTMGGLKMELVGRNLYDALSKVNMPNYKLELWPGYVTSIRQHEEDVLICCDVSHKVMRQDTMYDVLRTCMTEGGDWQEAYKRTVLGSVVLTGYNNKTYRIDDVDFDASPSSTFETKNGPKSIREYYSERYKLNIKDATQPLLVSKPKARDIRANRDQILLLVPELCRATGLTDKQRGNFTMMRDLAKHTQMDPMNRHKRLLQLVTRLYESDVSRQKLESFNTDIDKQVVTFNGRVLPQEKMIFGAGQTLQNTDKVDWQIGFRSNSMHTSVALKRWVFIYPPKCADASEQFLKCMMKVAQGMKYEIANPKMIALPSDRVSVYLEHLTEVISKDPKFIMVVLPNNAADRYGAIKTLACVEHSVPTQLIVAKTMTPAKGTPMSIATKVVIQINCKLGGAAWMVNYPMKGVMTVGFDIATDTRNKSICYGAFVASMDLQETVKYYSAVTSHKNEMEMSTNIESQFEGALDAFRAEHGTLPERIFFYRDGVSDGQIEYVHSSEVQRLNKKLEQVYRVAAITPKMTFIIVNKRINTRIFVKNGALMGNPVSGTIVDNTVTLPERYDFFLISQDVRQGTVAPTSYNVIQDTSGWSADKIQLFTYKQTHLYYNWSGCVRVPAVVQYAKKLSVLVSEFLHRVPSSGFNNQLYFL